MYFPNFSDDCVKGLPLDDFAASLVCHIRLKHSSILLSLFLLVHDCLWEKGLAFTPEVPIIEVKDTAREDVRDKKNINRQVLEMLGLFIMDVF